MNAKLFIASWKSIRMKRMIEYCLQFDDWFSFNDLVDKSCEQAIAAKQKGTKYLGSPNSARKAAMHLIAIGFLIIDPTYGVRVNKEFIPKSQQGRKIL